MKYSHMLLITLVISVIWGLLMFILGCILRFQQAGILNKFIENFEQTLNLKACKSPYTEKLDLCPTKTQFSEVDLGSWADFIGSVTIMTGFVIILLSACGFLGVIKKSQGILLVMLVLIIVAIGMEYYILDIVLDGAASFHQSAKEEILEKIRNEYTLEIGEVNDFTRMLNAIMMTSECCGVNGIKDFDINMTVIGKNNKVVSVLNPPACCDMESMQNLDWTSAFTDLLQCSSDSWAAKAADDGCYDLIHKDAFKSYGGAFVGYLMFLILWEGVQGILLFMIILRPTPKRKSAASSTASARSVARTAELPKKKFIPFSKISSFVTSDINRIKSTEIW